MRIQTANRVITAIVVPLAVLATASTLLQRHYREEEMRALVVEEQSLLAADQFRAGSDRLTAAARAYAATGDPRFHDEYRQEVMVDRNRDKAVAKLKELGLPDEELALVELAKRNSDRLIHLEDRSFAAGAAGDLPTAIGLVYGDEYRTAKASIVEPIQEFRRQLEVRLEADVRRTRRRARGFALVAATCVTASALAMLAALAFFYRKVVAPLAGLKQEIDQLLAGRKDVRVGYQTEPSEVGDIARSLESYRQAGDEVERQRWIKMQVSQISGELQRTEDYASFGSQLLARLAPLSEAGAGAVYRRDPSTGVLERMAAYGQDSAPEGRRTVKPGEGLVGQCAAERKAITLREVPPGYLQIHSGLGSAPPSVVHIVPITSQEAVLGVLELASFTEWSRDQEALIDEATPVVALNLEILSRNLRTQELLAETRQQAVRLQEQTGELTRSQQELLAQKEELEAQQKELEVARRKAEEATELKSMFLANMSHEIRTPMNAIIGLSHLALKTPMTAKQRDYIGKVHNAGTSLLGIINDILDFSKIEAGKLDLETTSFELDEVISTVTTVTGQKAHEKGLEFLADVPASVPQSLRGDPLRLGQILTNLVNNAVKFTESGEIRVRAELLEEAGDRVELRFSVKDTGAGMTPEQSARLFQPFTQADMSTTRKHGGTGLGLTISKRLVELMGGQIWLESEPGRGSTFFFTAWLGRGAPAGRGHYPDRLQHLSMLVVDDNPAAREILADALKDIGEQVDVVASGPEAIAAVRQHDAGRPYDVVFMDWKMPDMDGLEATRLIREDPALTRRPAVVMVTAFGREEVREEAEKLEVAGFLLKPVTKSMLVDTLVSLFAPAAGEDRTGQQATPSDRLAGVRLLLAEDNLINQQIAVELLEGVGARVEVAGNGAEALRKLLEVAFPPPFDAVLMDLQMPEMDGYQATARIRSDPRFARLPIVAMTAHATMEERQRCLDAGMNDHVSKPIDPEALYATLERWTRPARAPEAGPPAKPEAAPAPSPGGNGLPSIEGVDAVDGLARVAGNARLYRRLLEQFAAGQAEAGPRIAAALECGDREAAERIAHTVKGVAGNLGMKRLHDSARALEGALRDGDAAVPNALPNFQSLLLAQVAAIRGALAAPIAGRSEAPAARPADGAAVRAAIARLRTLLASSDGEAAEVFETVAGGLAATVGRPRLDALGVAIQEFDFEGALSKLDAIARDFGASGEPA